MDNPTKLQYLKVDLKLSLRFDVLLGNPQSPEKFLEYAQKVEELKSLDEKDSIIDSTADKKSANSSTLASTNKTMNPSQLYQQTPFSQYDFNNSYKRNQRNNNTTNRSVQ